MSPEIRISDADREAAVSALGEHYASGRLSKDEYDERASQAYTAKTASAVRPLFTDLPAPHPPVLGRSSTQPGYRATSQPPQGATPPRCGAWPFLPVLLVLVGIAIVASAPWIVFVALGVFWFTRGHRGGGCRRYRSGRDRAVRGSWA
jgi:hypothetical protein